MQFSTLKEIIAQRVHDGRSVALEGMSAPGLLMPLMHVLRKTDLSPCLLLTGSKHEQTS